MCEFFGKQQAAGAVQVVQLTGRAWGPVSDDRADVEEGEGTVGVLAPGDRDAQSFERYD